MGARRLGAPGPLDCSGAILLSLLREAMVVKAASVHHPYADLIGLELGESEDGRSRCFLSVAERHLNPHGVVHGAVLYALADTGMGAALYPSLSPGQICATIEIKMNYYRPVSSGDIQCHTEVVYRGRRVANMESSIYADDRLVAKANGSYSIFKLPDTPSEDG